MSNATYTGSPYGNQNATSPSMLSMLRSILAGQQGSSAPGSSAPNPAQPPAQNAAGGSQPQAGSSPSNPFGGAGSLIKGLINPPPTSILGQAKTSLMGGPGQSSGLGGAPPPPTAGPSISNAGPAGFEGNTASPANPFDPSTGTFSMQPQQAASLTNPGPSGGMTGDVPLPQPNPNGAFSGAQPPGAAAFNPSGVDPMTAALMANGAPAAAPDALASVAPDALSSLFL